MSDKIGWLLLEYNKTHDSGLVASGAFSEQFVEWVIAKKESAKSKTAESCPVCGSPIKVRLNGLKVCSQLYSSVQCPFNFSNKNEITAQSQKNEEKLIDIELHLIEHIKQYNEYCKKIASDFDLRINVNCLVDNVLGVVL